MAQPPGNRIARMRKIKGGEQASGMPKQYLRTTPIGCRGSARKLNLPRDTKTLLGLRDRHFSVGWHEWRAHGKAVGGQHNVIAALTFKRHATSRLPRKRRGIDACADHRKLGRHSVTCAHLNRAQLTPLKNKTRCSTAYPSGATRTRKRHQRGNIPARIAAMRTRGHFDAEGVGRRERRRMAAQVVGIELAPDRALRLPKPPCKRFGFEVRPRRIRVGQAAADHQMLDTRRLGECLMAGWRILKQRGKCARGSFNRLNPPPSSQEPGQPGREPRQGRRANDQRPISVEQITRDVSPEAGQRHGHDRCGAQPRPVAVTCRLHTTGLARLNDGNIVPIGEQRKSATGADHARADNDNLTHYQRLSAMKITLAFAPGACAIAPYILLKEAGAAFDTLDLNMAAGEHHQPQYLKINPKGKVPALIVDGTVITENVAIQCWIDRQFPQAGLMPSDPMQYIHALSVMGWCGSGIHPKLTQQARPERYCDAPNVAARVKELGHLGMIEQFELAEQMLAGKTWFFGERFGCADAYFYWTFRRGGAFGADLSRFTNCTAHRARVEARPSVKALLAHEDAVKAKLSR